MKPFQKYIWLIDRLLENPKLSFDDIAKLWEVQQMEAEPLSLRTFHEHRKAIRRLFGIDIECEKKGKDSVYFIKNREELDDSKSTTWLLRNYSIPQDFQTFIGLREKILLEEIPNKNFIENVMDALQRNVEANIGYQQYEGNRLDLHVQPYALKVYDRRWYLLGYVKESKAVRHLALDRMLNFTATNTSFTIPKTFDARAYYANSVGIYVNENLPIEKIKIRANREVKEYIRACPIHRSQEMTSYKNDGSAVFEYRLCITPDLVKKLLSFGDSIEVLEPEELREEMKKELQAALAKYVD